MTFSIVGADLLKGDWGVAVASKFPAVGQVVPWAKAGVGAVATQAWANTSYGSEGLALMGGGISARQTLDRLLSGDEGREDRQLGLVDARGRAATFTGTKCMEWAGGASGDGFACQGNILVGEQVVASMADAFRRAEGDLVDRLLSALIAGDVVGGDSRGRQSAALLVVREGGGYEGRNDRYVDVRVDDHPQSVSELARVFSVVDHELLEVDPAQVDVTVSGRIRDLYLAGRTDPSVRLDAFLVKLGRRTFELSAADVDHARGLSVVEVKPSRVRLRVSQGEAPS